MIVWAHGECDCPGYPGQSAQSDGHVRGQHDVSENALYRASDGTNLEDWSLIVGIQTGLGVEDKEILQGPGGRFEGGALHVRLRLMEQVPHQGGSGLCAQPEIQNKCGKLADPNLLLS